MFLSSSKPSWAIDKLSLYSELESLQCFISVASTRANSPFMAYGIAVWAVSPKADVNLLLIFVKNKNAFER